MVLNERQRGILAIGVALFIIAGLFPPWVDTFNTGQVHTQTPSVYAFIASPPAPHDGLWSVGIDISRLIVEWVIVIVATAFGAVVPGTQGPGRIEIGLRRAFQNWAEKVKLK